VFHLIVMLHILNSPLTLMPMNTPVCSAVQHSTPGLLLPPFIPPSPNTHIQEYTLHHILFTLMPMNTPVCSTVQRSSSLACFMLPLYSSGFLVSAPFLNSL
jgi:hypothetical protein